MISRRKLPWLVLLFSLVFVYQNCGSRFETSGINSLALRNSAQCTHNHRAAGIKALTAAEQIDCLNLDQYECEVRVFGPSENNESGQTRSCFLIDGRTVCIKSLLFSFDTSAARSSSSESGFADGGEYNHSESRCYHAYEYKGVKLFVGENSSAEKAFQSAREQCLLAKQGASQ